LNEQLAQLDRVILFLTSDEYGNFPSHKIAHPDMQLWVQLPRPEYTYPDNTTFITEGSGRAWTFAEPNGYKDLEWFLSCQVQHPRRRRTMEALVRSRIRPNVLNETPEFLGGMDRFAYLAHMARAKMCPAPSGHVSQSSFRAVEAIEMGSVPLIDAVRDDDEGRGYWEMAMPGIPAPRVESWTDIVNIMAVVRDTWEERAIDCHTWWHQHRRDLARRLARQARWLQGEDVDVNPTTMTVIIPTSPIPSHPSIEIIEDTVRSIMERTNAEIIIQVDGVRKEQAGRADDYALYTRRLLLAAEQWPNVTPIVYKEHLHQAEMLRRTLDVVDSEYILYVEHDTPLVNDIPWDDIIHTMREHRLNVMRFHHESHILDDHKHLMVGRQPQDGWWPTMQFSQRPHIARTQWYRDVLQRFFDPSARVFIEDTIYGVLANAKPRAACWEEWRTAIYHPEGTIQRSIHTDGRGIDPKYGNHYAYPDDKIPAGAPHPQVGE
jgi:hypothetical protein